jgi:hypothetical protein
MSSNDNWKVFAVNFSAWGGRLRHENFIIASRTSMWIHAIKSARANLTKSEMS